jgi:hypothetical protein
MKKCDKRDPIFKNVENCASDEDFEKVMKNNIYMYYADNVIDYTEYSNVKFPYFKQNKALFYETLETRTLNDHYTSYQFNM